MPPVIQTKNVKWTDQERVDREDFTALSDLKDEHIKEVLKQAFEVADPGVVLTGFEIGGSTGLDLDFDGVDSLALDADGGLLGVPAASPASVTLTANGTHYIHAYLIETDSDSDNRRFINTVPSPPEEVTQNVPTRQTKLVGYYVKTNADATPLASAFLTSQTISGKVRKLVAICAAKTDGVGVTSTVDFRRMWMVNGNQIPTVNGGANELPFTVGATNGDRNVKGLSTMFRAITSTLWKLLADPTTRDWWDPTFLFTDPASGQVATTLRNRLSTNKTVMLTVDQTTGRGDFDNIVDAFDQAPTLSVIEVKPSLGAYTEDGEVSIGNSAVNPFILLRGADHRLVNIDRTVAAATPLLHFNAGIASSFNFEGIHFSTLSTQPLIKVDNAGATVEITFRRCKFTTSLAGYVLDIATGVATSGSLFHILFDDCEFVFGASGIVNSGDGSTRNIMFNNCRFRPVGTNAQIGVPSTATLSGLNFNACQFGLQTTAASWKGFGASIDVAALKCYDCRFELLNRLIDGGANTTDLMFRNCVINAAAGATALFGSTSNLGSTVGPLSLVNCTIVTTNYVVLATNGFRVFVSGCNIYASSVTVGLFKLHGHNGGAIFQSTYFYLNFHSGEPVIQFKHLATNSTMTLNVVGCTFDNAGSSHAQYCIETLLDSAVSTVTTIDHFTILGSNFINNTHATQKPIHFDGDSSTLAFYTLIVGGCTWQNGADGAITDRLDTITNNLGTGRGNAPDITSYRLLKYA